MRHYALKDFLRATPNELLAEYFKRDGLLSDLDFNKLTPRKIEPVFEGIQQLPDAARAKVDTDFQDVFALAYAGGVRLLLDEARYHDLDFTDAFGQLKGHHAKAFWAFLNHKKILDDALLLACRENLSGHWRKRRGLPTLHNADFSAQKDKFAGAIGVYFKNEGRGRACIVDYTNRDRLHYFFAYPEDYSQSHLHYVNGVLKRDSHSPAFQVIFLYDTAQGMLDIYHQGSKDVIQSLQGIFAQSALGIGQLAPSQKEAYELDALKHSKFQFKLRPEWGIEKITIIQFGISRWVNREPRQWLLKCGKGSYPAAIYEELDLVAPYHPQDGRPPRASVIPYFARIQVEFATPPGTKRKSKRTFNITLDGCDLKYEGRDLILRQMLIDSGLEGSDDAAERKAGKPVLQPA